MRVLEMSSGSSWGQAFWFRGARSWGGKLGIGFARIGIAKRRRELGKARSCSR